MKTPLWTYLHNAKYIDQILEHVKSHPERWRNYRNKYWDIEEINAWDNDVQAAREDAWEISGIHHVIARGAVRDAFLSAKTGPYSEACDAACNAAYAFMAYNDAGAFMEMSVDEVQAHAEMKSKPALLLLPARIALGDRDNGNPSWLEIFCGWVGAIGLLYLISILGERLLRE